MKTKIIDLTHDGKGIGRIENKAVFVPSTYPGEIVDIEITKEKKKYLEGKTIEILEKSKDRIYSICQDFYRCNGCQFCDFKYSAQLEYKKKRVINDFKKFAGIELESVKINGMENFYNYRNHVQLKVEEKEIGYIDKDKEKVFTPKNCVVAPKKLKEITDILKVYVDINKINLIGIRKNYLGEIMLILVTKEKTKLDISNILNFLKELNITHIYQNINKNPRFHYGKESIKLFGTEEFKEKILENEFILSPTSFFQINREQAEYLYKKAVRNLDLKSEDKVLELYSGTGTITMEIGKTAKKVLGIEYAKSSVEDAKVNAKINNLENVEFISGKVEEKLSQIIGKYNKILLDPPRAGAEKSVIESILKLNPEIISYISCDPATLARDVGLLVEDGDYKLENVEIVDMFPLTSHVETVVLMSRN